MSEPDKIGDQIAQQPEEELGGGAQAHGSPGAPPGPQGTDADLHGVAQSLEGDERTAGLIPSQLLVGIVGRIICGPQQGAAGGPPLTPQERFEGFAGMLIGDGNVPGLLSAIDFDNNVLALMSRGGIGSNLSPGVAVGLGVVALVGAAFMFRAPKQAKPAPSAAPPTQPRATAGPMPAPQGATA
jgi:hypothetical protein